MNEFQDRINELLNEHKANRTDLSKILKINSSSIDAYFNKNHFPSINIAIKMAQYFDCSLDYLFGRSDEVKNNNKNSKSFFETFDSLIKDNNLSIAGTMRDLNMSENNYYRWKKGLFPKTLKILDVAKYFEVSVDFLVGYTGNTDE